MPVGVLDEVEDLHDLRVHDLGEELPFGHRDRLRLGVAGVHQAFEHHRPVVDVVVDGQVDPTQSAVRDAALDLVLAGDDVAGTQLGQERIRAAAVRAPALRCALAVRRRSGPTGLSAVPAEPLGLRHHRIGHQGLERIDIRHPGDLDQPAAELPDRRQHPRGHRHPVLRFGVHGAGEDVRQVVVIVVEIGAEQRLGGLSARTVRRRVPTGARLGCWVPRRPRSFERRSASSSARPSVHVPRRRRGGRRAQNR